MKIGEYLQQRRALSHFLELLILFTLALVAASVVIPSDLLSGGRSTRLFGIFSKSPLNQGGGVAIPVLLLLVYSRCFRRPLWFLLAAIASFGAIFGGLHYFVTFPMMRTIEQSIQESAPFLAMPFYPRDWFRIPFVCLPLRRFVEFALPFVFGVACGAERFRPWKSASGYGVAAVIMTVFCTAPPPWAGRDWQRC